MDWLINDALPRSEIENPIKSKAFPVVSCQWKQRGSPLPKQRPLIRLWTSCAETIAP